MLRSGFQGADAGDDLAGGLGAFGIPDGGFEDAQDLGLFKLAVAHTGHALRDAFGLGDVSDGFDPAEIDGNGG